MFFYVSIKGAIAEAKRMVERRNSETRDRNICGIVVDPIDFDAVFRLKGRVRD